MNENADAPAELRELDAGIDRCADALKRGARALVRDHDPAPSVEAIAELTQVLLHIAEMQTRVAAVRLDELKVAAAAIAPTPDARKLDS